ncbi:MAG: HupE/UreJ family protein [Pseudomonadota bacterium]
MLIWFTTLSVASAHEVMPAIADLRAEEGTVTVSVRASIESFVAGVDLSRVSDTNESAQAALYDALRALPPETLSVRFASFWPEMAERITLRAGETDLDLTLQSVSVDPVGNPELVRFSLFEFTAPLPEGAHTLQFGWAPEYGALVLRQMDVPAPFDAFLDNGSITDPFPLAGGGETSGVETFLDYIPVGFDHIVPKGLDHILFVLGLFFLAARFRPLLIQVSLFTVAHTITLALAALGYTRGIEMWFADTLGVAFIDVVEPLIALSIAYVAIENIFMKGISPWRPLVIFIFGLLHGLGFASVLAEFGLPDATFVAALIGFNVGVELGQLAVIAVMFFFVWQALRVDRGENEVVQSLWVYAVFFVAGAGVLWAFGQEVAAVLSYPLAVLDVPAVLFGVSMCVMAVLCLFSVLLRDTVDAYRRFVAVPASVVVAAIGLYWFIQRSYGTISGI